MNRIQIRNLSFLALAMVAATSLIAQESTGQIVGTVKTRAGEPLGGVEVRFTSPVLQGVRVVATVVEPAGTWWLDSSPPKVKTTFSSGTTSLNSPGPEKWRRPKSCSSYSVVD